MIYGLPSDDAIAKIESIMEKEDKKQQKNAEAKQAEEIDEDEE